MLVPKQSSDGLDALQKRFLDLCHESEALGRVGAGENWLSTAHKADHLAKEAVQAKDKVLAAKCWHIASNIALAHGKWDLAIEFVGKALEAHQYPALEWQMKLCKGEA